MTEPFTEPVPWPGYVEWSKHEMGRLVEQRDVAHDLLRDLRPFLVTFREDITAVLTVYDEHVAPDDRGPWRDRLHALVTDCSEVTDG